MASAPKVEAAGDAPRRSWWHVLGKCLIVTALLAGAGIPLLMWLLIGIGPFERDGTIILLHMPPMFSMPMVGALAAAVAVVYEARFARLLVVGACLFLFFGPMEEFEPGGPLHGGEIVFALHALGAMLACAGAVPGLLLWRRQPAPPPATEKPNPWSRPAVYPGARRPGLK